MKVLIAGYPILTVNYQHALSACDMDYQVDLQDGPSGLSKFDALLLPGGGDIAPELFGQPNRGSKNIDRSLDESQLNILHFFVNHQKPVLGICKGMQLINIYFGGNIIQNLHTASLHAYKHKDQIHQTKIAPASFLYDLYGSEAVVNSAHHQGIGSPGRGIRVIQQTADGVAEALIHERLPIRAVQWHPERMCGARSRTDTADGSLIFSSFRQLIGN